MLISFYKYMVNNFCPTLVESDKWGDVSALLILQLDQARGLRLGFASKYILRFSA